MTAAAIVRHAEAIREAREEPNPVRAEVVEVAPRVKAETAAWAAHRSADAAVGVEDQPVARVAAGPSAALGVASVVVRPALEVVRSAALVAGRSAGREEAGVPAGPSWTRP